MSQFQDSNSTRVLSPVNCCHCTGDHFSSKIHKIYLLSLYLFQGILQIWVLHDKCDTGQDKLFINVVAPSFSTKFCPSTGTLLSVESRIKRRKPCFLLPDAPIPSEMDSSKNASVSCTFSAAAEDPKSCQLEKDRDGRKFLVRLNLSFFYLAQVVHHEENQTQKTLGGHNHREKQLELVAI